VNNKKNLVSNIFSLNKSKFCTGLNNNLNKKETETTNTSTSTNNKESIDKQENKQENKKENKPEEVTDDIAKEIINNLKEIIAKNPKDYLAHHNLGIYYQKNKRYEEAIQCYLKSVELSPEHYTSLLNLGYIYLKTDIDKALEYFLKVDKMKPNLHDVLVQISLIYEKKGEKELSLAYTIKILETSELFKNSQKLMSLIAFRYRELNKIEESNKYLFKIIELPNYDLFTLVELSNNYISIKKYDEALKYLLRYEELGGEMIHTIYNDIALIYYNNSKIAESLKYYKLSQEKSPSYLNLISIGTCYYHLGRKEECKEIFKEALKFKDISKVEEAYCNYNIGLVHFEFYEYEQALHYAKLSEKYYFLPDKLNTLLGNICFEMKNYEEALKYYKKIKNIKEEFYSVLNIGRIYLKLNDKAEAEKTFKKYIDLAEDKAEAEYTVGFTYVNQNDETLINVSLVHLLRVVEINPNYPNVNYALGRYYSYNKQDELSIKYLLKSLEIDGPTLELYNLLGYNYGILLKYDESIKYLLKAVDLFGEDDPKFDTYYNLGRNYYQLYKIDEALNYCLKANEIEPEHSENLLLIALCYLGEKVEDEEKAYELKVKALGYLDKAVKYSPNNYLVHYYLGEVLYDILRDDEAIEHLKKAIEINANYESPYLLLAYIMNTQNMKEEAIEYYKKAIEIQPNNSGTHTSLSFILRELGRNSEADEHYQISLSLMSNKED